MILMYVLGRVLVGKPYIHIDTLLIWCAFICTYSVASLYNYVADTKIDHENNKYNPINSKIISVSAVPFLSCVAISLALIFVAFTNEKILNSLGVIALTFLSVVYSHPRVSLQKNAIGKIITMWLNYALIPILIGLGASISSGSFALALNIAVLYLLWLPYSDIPDIEGDRKYGKITLAVKFGVRKLTVGIAFLGTVFAFLVNRSLQSICGRNIYIEIILIAILLFEWAVVIDSTLIKSKKLRIIAGYLLFLFLIMLIIYC